MTEILGASLRRESGYPNFDREKLLGNFCPNFRVSLLFTHLVMNRSHLDQFVNAIYEELLPNLKLQSIDPNNPVKVYEYPSPWQLLGAGNYAAVLCHPNYAEQVVKIYAPDRPGFEEEVEVYHRLGSHPAFSECFYAKDGFLVLKRLTGVTLYDCLHRGLRIPKRVIEDIDQALDYARNQGLHPHDVHGRNVMMLEGRGLVVDISDFLRKETCTKWDDLKRAYYWLYLPIFYPLRLRVPYWLLDKVRSTYRVFRRFLKGAKR